LIYVTIPVHNEAPTIGILLWKLRKVMAEFGRDYRVLVLDDASSDRTGEVLGRYTSHIPLTVIRSEERLGFGGALERLVREAVEAAPYPKRDVVVTIQGDFTESPEDLVPLVKAIEGGADLVAGSPEVGEDVLPRGVRFARWAARLVLGRGARQAPVTDPLSSFRAYRVVVLRKALRDLKEGEPLLTAAGWGANLELLARAAPHARRIEEIPFRARVRHRTRPSRFRAIAAVRDLLPLRNRNWAVEGEKA